MRNSWSNLKDEIEKMSEDEPDKILKIVKEILDFDKKNSEKSRVWD